MRLMRVLALAVIATATSMLAGCGRSPAYPPTRAVEVVAVPSDRVVTRCPDVVDEDEDEPASAHGVAYVRLDEWQAPPAVKELESKIVPRGDAPPDYIEFPPLAGRYAERRGLSLGSASAYGRALSRAR